MKNLLRWAATCAVLAGCASHSTMVNRPVSPEELPALIKNSPHVTALSPTRAKRTEPDKIALHNFHFHALNQPDGLTNWKYHYVIGEGSIPAWSYERVAEIQIYLRTRADPLALPRFRRLASEMGGDAVIEMHRKPIITRQLPAPIDAYLYYGVVVRRTD